MSNIKKIIGILLALVMALSMAVIAFAAPVANPEYSVKVTADETELEPGQSANVTVTVTSNFNVSAVSIPVYFDKTKVTVSEAKSDLANAKIARETSVGAEKYFEGLEGLTTENCGLVAVVYVAAQGTEISSYNNKTVMTFKVTANEDATGSVDLECFASTVKKSDHPSGTLYVAMNGTNNNEKVDALGVVVDNANVEGAKATINILGGGDPELVLTDLGEEYGTIIRNDLCTTDYDGCVFGIPTLDGEVIEDYVTAENGSIEVVANEESDEYTTGATIILMDNAGEPVATYVFIYFGDVNGDGEVDITDASDIEAHDQWLIRFDDDTAAYYAADVNGDGEVDITDASDVEAHDQWLVRLDEQNVLAANFNEVW